MTHNYSISIDVSYFKVMSNNFTTLVSKYTILTFLMLKMRFKSKGCWVILICRIFLHTLQRRSNHLGIVGT